MAEKPPELILIDPQKPQEKEIKQDEPKIEEKFVKHEKIISSLENSINNIENVYHYNKIKNGLLNNSLSEDDLSIFFVYQAEKISDLMFIVSYAWNKELETIKNEEDKRLLNEKINKLYEIRKKHANNFEKLLEKIKNIKGISDKEKEYFINKVKNWNKNQKLRDKND